MLMSATSSIPGNPVIAQATGQAHVTAAQIGSTSAAVGAHAVVPQVPSAMALPVQPFPQ